MRVVIFTNAYKPTVSGVVTSIALFRKGLIEGGHDVHIVAPEYRDFEDEEPYVFRLPALDLSNRLDLSLAMPLKAPIATALRGIKPAVIHSQHPILMGDLAAAFAQDLRVPLVFTFHSRYDEYAQQYVPVMPVWADKVTEEIVGRYLEKCAHIVAPTPSVRDLILHHYTPNAPVTVVPTPVDLGQYDGLDPRVVRTGLGLGDTEVLLYVGRLAREKNLGFLLRAFARIVATRSQARLLMVGDGPEGDGVRDTARDLGLGDKVVFTGAIPHGEVPDYAAAANVFVFSSLTETQGLVLIEAMAAGTPVVAVEAPSSVDVLAEGGGVLVPAREEAFANAVLALLADRPRLRATGEQAVRVVRRYTVPAARESLLSAYEEAIAAGPTTRGKAT
jgi:glycosyltransferase involved in cell wall biosynthesis